MEVDEDGSISVNVRSHARGYVVADEIVAAKGITMDTLMDCDEGKSMEVDEDGSTVSVNVRSVARGDVVADEIVVTKGGTKNTLMDDDEGMDM